MRFLFNQKLSKYILKKIWLLVVFCFFTIAKSQSYYTTNPLYLKSKQEKNNLLSKFIYTYPDTLIYNNHNYFPRNFLGNIGLPSPTYSLAYNTIDLGFNLNPTPYQNDYFKSEDVTYYKSKGPYASLTGIAGSKKFQIFKLLFTHTYKDKINFTIGFNRYTSQGFYLKQQSYTNNFYLSSNYSAKNEKFGYYFYILTNGNKNQENGGIRADSLTETTLIQNKELLSVRLNGALRENREKKVMLNPYLRLNKTNDSSSKLNHIIQLKSTFSANSYQYKDDFISSDKYYNIMYLDTLRTNDSSHVRKLMNEFNYVAVTSNSNLALSFGYKNEINQVWQKADSLFSNHIAKADLNFTKIFSSNDSIQKNEKKLETHINFQYIFAGTNKSNYLVEAKSKLILNKLKNRYLYFNIVTENRSADYIYNYWVSNHFSWFNNMHKSQKQLQTIFGFHLNKFFSSSIYVQNVRNYLFFDNVASPQQYSKPLTNIGFNLNVTKIFMKHLGSSLNYCFQHTSNITYIRLPKNQVTAKLFYTGNLFKNNLQLQIGGQLQAYQSFYSYGYMPATQAFYLQEDFKTTPYPFLDVYINARIRPVAFFLKVENALQGFVGTNYAFAAGYLQTDRAFRFGISWTFFD